MRITEIEIKNYRSFDPIGQAIIFPTLHSVLVGKNNSGKSNILTALDLILGYKNPAYVQFEEDDYFDSNQPIEIKVVISNIETADKSKLFAIPNLTKAQQGALNAKISDGSADITFLLRKNFEYTPPDEAEEETESSADTFEVKLWGFNVFRKKEDARKAIIKILTVPAIRNYKDELSASGWTTYGQLMRDVLESSDNYADIKNDLVSLNAKIQQAFENEKTQLVAGARIVSYVDDISFQLTKENSPSELLRNLEIFIKEGTKLFNIKKIGTGTQSAIIIGIFELAIKNKTAKLKVLAIEEPEIYIHPHGIRYLGTLIKSLSAEQNTQVIISTHSLSLTANFEPKEIILVSKEGGKTVIKQNSGLSGEQYRRFIHQDNAEIFFSDRVIFVEGATEKHLFCNLDKKVKQDSSNPDSDNCNFDRINVGIIRLDSVDSIVNYITITEAFDISFSAMVDKDFISHSVCRTLCTKLGITYQTTNQSQLIADLKAKNIVVITRGEVEDLFPDQEIASASGQSIAEVGRIKTLHQKTSSAFKEIFGVGKAQYAIKLADYYINNNLNSPLDDLIRKFYLNYVAGIVF